MQSNDLEKVPTHLMSDVYTLGFEPIFMRRSITIQNNVLDVHLNTLFQQAHEIWIHIACVLSFSINVHVTLPSADRGHDF